MLAATLAALLVATPLSVSPQSVTPQSSASTQAATAAATANASQDAVRLEDLTVTGRPLDRLVDAFTREVAAPNRDRSLARWRSGICVSTFNLRPDGAQYLIDRVSTVAQDIGLTPGAPGCSPTVLIVATDHPSEMARALAERSKRVLRPGGAGMDRGGSALRAFESSSAPVRWWQVSMPVDSMTLGRATRIPGETYTDAEAKIDAPTVSVMSSKATNQIVDDIYKTIIILDAREISNVSSQQLADYVSMVTLAQINPQANTSGYASILNVFQNPDATPGLTEWDKAYLSGLYATTRTQRNINGAREEIVDSIVRAHHKLRQEDN